MTPRYSVRRPVQGTVAIDTKGLIGQGRVMNVSVPGCLLETGLHLHIGQAVQLQLKISNGIAMTVDLAMVRWINGCQAGLEFIGMSTEDQAQLRSVCGYGQTAPSV